MSAPKSQRRRPTLVTYLLLSFGIFILAALNYVFTKLLDRAYGNFNGVDVEYIFSWIVVFVIVFAVYLWLIDIRGTIAQMLGQSGEGGWSIHVKKAGFELEVSGATEAEVEELFNKAVEKLKPPELPPQGEPQPRNNMERVKMAWDLKRDLLINTLVLIFSGYLVIAQIINGFPSNTDYWVIIRLTLPLPIFAYFAYTISGYKRKFKDLAIVTERRLQMVEGGSHVPGLDELLDKDANP